MINTSVIYNQNYAIFVYFRSAAWQQASNVATKDDVAVKDECPTPGASKKNKK